MMKKYIFFFALLILAFYTKFNELHAQNIQYANRVVKFSSEYTSKKYSAQQILGRPSNLPEGKFFGNTWAADGKAKNAFIKVGFEKPMKIQQVIIFEFHRANTISHIYTYDINDKEYLIYTNKPENIKINKRTLSIKIPETEYEVAAIKIVCDFTKFDNQQTHIDAVAISDSQEPILSSINLTNNSEVHGKPIRLGGTVNSKCGELVPIISSDGNSMFFLRDNCSSNIEGAKEKSADIYFSKREDDNWTLAENIGFPINNKGNNALFSVSPDGNNILIKGKYSIDGSFDPIGGLSLSRKTKDGWSQPKLMNIKNYYTHTDVVNFFLADDWKTLILAIERDDSYGYADFYVSFKIGENTWSEPKHMGAQLNSTSTDFSPFLAPDGKTFYFASYTLPGYGSADMFMSKRLDDTWQNWSEPVNLGPQINSKGFDAYYRITADGKYAYYASSNGEYSSDIYLIELPLELRPEPIVVIAGKVLNAETNEPVEAKISYENLSNAIEIGETTSNPIDGYYSITMPFGNKIGFRANAKGFVAVNENIDLSTSGEFQSTNRNIYLKPIEIGQLINLNNLFFDFGKSTLLKESYPELNRLVDLLNENSKMKIQLLGHTDNIGSNESNINLSKDRVESVKKYLIDKGIEAVRITEKGFGSSQPIAPNDTEENRQMNRRVEMKIISL
jgi:OmpA-OmpF porin, OOP family